MSECIPPFPTSPPPLFHRNLVTLERKILPPELILDIVEIPHSKSTLAALSLVSQDIHKRCIPRLWQHLDLRGFADIATVILAINSNPALARHIHSVAFMFGDRSAEIYKKHLYEDTDCSPSCFHELPEGDKEKITAVYEGEDVDVTTPGKEWSAAELLPQKLLCLLDTYGLPPDQRSYALPIDAPWKWYESLVNGVLASRRSCPERDTHAVRCFSSGGDTHASLGGDIVKPIALHLFGRPIDWTRHESPSNTPTFARFPGAKQICFSIHTWHEDDDDDCNIFERLSEYDQYYSRGSLERVVVRMTPEVGPKVRKAFESYHWPRGRDIVEFRLWDIAGASPDDAVAQDLRSGKCHDWVDRSDVLGRRLSLDLSDLANTVHPISPGVSITSAPTNS